MAKTRVFVSFDYDNDRGLRDLLLGQAALPDSPFEVSNYSLKEAAPEKDWEAKARAAIARAEKVIVLLGPRTVDAPGVLKEVLMAQALSKPRFQIIGYTNGSEKWAVPGGGRTYAWTWANLKALLA